MKQFYPNEIKCHFNLRYPNSDRPSPVFLVVRIGGKQYKFQTGVKVYPKHWSPKYEKAMVSHKLNDIHNQNNQIVNEKIKAIIFLLKEQKPYLCSETDYLLTIKQIIKTMGRKTKPTIDIIEVLLAGIENSNLTDGTKKNQRNFVEHLKDFICSDEAKPFNIKNFQDLAQTEVFEVFRANIKKRPHIEGGKIVKEEKLRTGFANKIVRGVRTLLKKYAIKGKVGFLTVTDVNNINLSNLPTDYSDDDNKIFLRDDEVLKMYNYECEDPMDAVVKDLFVLQCTVGFRISEIIEIKKHIQYGENGKIYINFKSEKTKRSKAKVDCVVHFDLAKKILMKYKDVDFPKIDIKGDYDRRIKKISKKCGFVELCEQVRHYDGEEEARSPKVEKYKLISSHTARHTFIVLMLLRRTPFEKIQRFTGHKSYDMILYYSQRMKQIDYENFEQLKKEHPEQVLLSCEEADNGGLVGNTPPSTQVPLTASTNDIDQLQKLLITLGENGQYVLKITDYIDLQMMLDERVKVLCDELCKKFGEEAGKEMYRQTKIVWYVEEIPLQEKCSKIIDIITSNTVV